MDPRVWVVKGAGEQESVPIFRTCPKERTPGKNSPFSAPLDAREFFNYRLFPGEGERKRALFPWQWKIYIV